MEQIDLFQPTKTQHVIEREYTTEHRPISLLNQDSSIEFDVSLSENEMIKFNDTYLYVKFKLITKPTANGTKNKTRGANYLLNSLFRQIVISANGVEITQPIPDFMYKAYLEAKLGYSENAKISHLKGAYWYDTPEEAQKMLGGGETMEMMGRLHLDLTHQQKAFPGPCNLHFKLDMNSPMFLFETDSPDLKLEIIDLNLMVQRLVLNPKSIQGIKQKHQRTEMVIPLSSSYCRAIPIAGGTLDISLEDVCRGKMPKSIYFAMVENTAYNGTFTSNPYDFKPFNLNFLAAYIDGAQFPSIAYQPNFEKKHCMREFMGLARAIRQNDTDSLAKISYEQFIKSPIFGISLQPDLDEGDAHNVMVNPAREGILRMQLRFAKPLEESITAIILMDFDSEIRVDPDGNFSFKR